MSSKYLGDSFDLHTGGIDNMFPHHEDEIAQSEAATGKKWVNYWLHCEHLMVNGEKMSKSLGNFYTLRDLLNMGWSGREIRYVLTGSHYRKKLNFSFDALKQARETLGKFDELFTRMKGITTEGDCPEIEEIANNALTLFSNSMADDLNSAAALAAFHELARGANRLADEGKLTKVGAEKVLETFRQFDRIFACLDVDASKEQAIPEEIVALAEARAAAKKAKNYAESDRCRNEIASLGYAIEDIPGGAYRIKKI
jgi:cysteinyl-tRNA synthetase